METLTPPNLTAKYPVHPKRVNRIGPAWADAWAYLIEHQDEWTDGVKLARQIGEQHNLSPDTLIGLFTRMATAEHLARKHEEVPTTRGLRKRTHYRIPKGA